MKNKLNMFSTAFLIILVAACGKTTKGKMSREWNVVSYEESGKSIMGEEYFYAYSASMDQATKTFIFYSQSPGEPVQSDTTVYTVNSNTMTINKDGSWKETTVLTNPGNNNLQTTTEVSGTWNFIRKNKEEEFKKNERVMFNVLQSKTAINGTPDTEDKYLAGENVLIYNVTESSKKKLTLELESSSSSTHLSPNNNYSYVTGNPTKVKMILEEK